MEAGRLFQFSIDNSLEIVIAFDRSGIITYANKAAHQLLEYEGLPGNPIEDIFPLSFRVENNEVVMDSDLDDVQNMMAYRQNQTCFPVRGKVLLFDDEMYVYNGHDTSEETFLEKKANQALSEVEAALKVKSEFVANVTHELRTPVNGVSGNIRDLMGMETDSEKLKLMQMVERSCVEMNALINNILDFSKLEAGKFVLEPREFDFRGMIDYVKGNHSNRITEKGLDFTFSVSPEIPGRMIGDELRIVQVLNNLISNAYKFTSIGGIHIDVVKTAQKGNRVELFFMVSDTGIGIAKADQDKLFKSFSQVDASISRRYGGTGLGLNITKQLIELMGGEIHVQSDAGKGTVFSFGIWVDVPENQTNAAEDAGIVSEETADKQELLHKLQSLAEEQGSSKMWTYGEPENREELEKKLSRLILSVEMENWEKAEMFAETVRQLVDGAPREVKSAALRLKMAVQKSDYDKVQSAYEMINELL